MKQDDWQRLKTQFQLLQHGKSTLVLIAFDAAALFAVVRLGSGTGAISKLAAIGLLTLVLLHAYLLLHEATHSAVSQNKAFNNWVGHLCGWMILMPFLSRQRSHLLHHMWTGHPTGDLANQRIIQRFSVMTHEQGERLERIWKSWLPLLTLNDRIGMWKDPFQQRLKGSKSRRLVQEIQSDQVYLFGYAVFFVTLGFLGALPDFFICFIPAIGLQLILEEMTNLPHHAETPLLDASAPALPYWEQHLVTHSCKSLPIWSRFILLNFNLHTAHHLFPTVPWHGLPAVHREVSRLMPELERDQQTRSELAWSLINRRRPLLEIMGHYFDKISEQSQDGAPMLPLEPRPSEISQ